MISPSSTRTDRGRKRALYQEVGVAEYWVADCDLRRIEIWRPGSLAAEVQRTTLSWQPDPRAETLTLDLGEIFR